MSLREKAKEKTEPIVNSYLYNQFGKSPIPFIMVSYGELANKNLTRLDLAILRVISFKSNNGFLKFRDKDLAKICFCTEKKAGDVIRKLHKMKLIKCLGPLGDRMLYSSDTLIKKVCLPHLEEHIKEYDKYLIEEEDFLTLFYKNSDKNRYIKLDPRLDEVDFDPSFEGYELPLNPSKKGRTIPRKKVEPSLKRGTSHPSNEGNDKNEESPNSSNEADLQDSEKNVSNKEILEETYRENKENIIPKGIIVSSKDETKSDFGKSHPKSNSDSLNLKGKIETSLPSKNINTDSDNNIETSPLRKTKQTSFIDYDDNPAADEEYVDYYELDRNIDDPDEVFHDRDYTEEEEEELNRIDWDEVFPNGHPDINNNIPSKEEFKSASEEENKDCGPDPILLEKNRLMLEEGITARAAAGDWEQVTNLNRAYISLYKTEFIPSDADIQNFLNPKKEEKEKERKKKGGLVLSEDKETRRERMKKAVNSEAAKQVFQLNREAEYVIANWERVGFPPVKDKNRDYTLDLIKKFLEGKFSGIIPSYRGKKEDREYSYHEIIAGIQNRKLKAFDSGYYPGEDMKKKMRKMTLSAWLFIPGKEKDPSTFLKDFYIPPKKVTSSFGLIDDVNPAFTNLVKQIYAKEVLGSIPTKWNETDEGKFRLATKKFEEFKKENRNRLDDFILYPPTPEKVARLFVKSAAYAVDGDYSKLNIGWLCTDKHFNERLPKFLNDKGLLKAI